MVREVFRTSEVVTCGTLAIPAGRAIAVPGGYRVSGRWPFGSGCLHARWFASNTTVFDGDAPRIAANGQPERRVVVTAAEDVRILDTWHVYGLRGTGSNDYAIDDVFVPGEFTFPAVGAPLHPGRFHQHRTFLLAHPAHALGIARRCLDAYRDLVATKSAPFGPEPLAQLPMTQTTLARAEALIGSARAYVAAVVADFWETLSSGGRPSPEQCARVRIAMTTGVGNSLQAVRMAYEAAGTTGIYEGHPLERGMRDLTVASQHAAVAARSWETAGRALLGLEQKAPYLF